MIAVIASIKEFFMTTVNSNIAAKYALNNLNKTDRDLTSAMERLSSKAIKTFN